MIEVARRVLQHGTWLNNQADLNFKPTSSTFASHFKAKWPSDVLPLREPPAAEQQPAGHECPGRQKDDEPPVKELPAREFLDDVPPAKQESFTVLSDAFGAVPPIKPRAVSQRKTFA